MSISHLLTQTVWVAPIEGRSKNYGDPQFGSPCAVACRLDRKVKVFRDDTGNERETTHIITTDREVSLGSMVWFSQCDAGDTSKGYEVVLVEHSQTPDGSLLIWEARV